MKGEPDTDIARLVEAGTEEALGLLTSIDDQEECLLRDLEEIKLTRRKIVYALLHPGDGPLDLDTAVKLYWHAPQIRAKWIAEALGVTIYQLVFNLVGQFPAATCACGGTVYATSRTVLAELRNPKHWRNPPICNSCREHRDAERKREWEARDEAVQARQHALQPMPYDEYLRTQEWRHIEAAALEFAGYRCQLCNESGPLIVHDRTPHIRGRMRGQGWSGEDSDVVVLCEPCYKATE